MMHNLVCLFIPNSCASPIRRFGGAITAALYLSEFITPVPVKSKVEQTTDPDGVADISALKVSTSLDSDAESEKPPVASTMTWFHVDFGGSKGGAADPQGMRAVYEYIKAEHCK